MSILVGCLGLRRALVAFAAVASVGLAAAAPANAHSFLIRSDPAASARLAKTPAALKLYFSEPFVRGSEQVNLRRVGGETLELPKPTSGAATLEQPLPANLRGIYIVHWRVLSDDGHISLGEFAFAVGSNAALPNLKASTTRTSWSEVAASWLVFIGLALALGGLASERFIWRRTPLTARAITAAPVWPGVALATGGAFLQLVVLAGDRRGGGLSAGLSESAIADALATRPGKLTLALIISVLIGAAFLPLRWWRVTAIVPFFAAVVFIAARGHSGTSGHGWAVVADIIHLTAVAVWLGALAHLVLVVVRSGAARATLVEGARRYARFALPTVIVISATGILTAIPEFRSFGSVFTSGYGRTLLIKAALIAVALMFALAARRWALPANPHPRLPLLKRLTVAEATVLAAVLIVVAVLVNAAPPRGPAAAATPAAALGPPPVAGPSLQLADLAGQLGLAVTAGAKELQFTVVPPGDQLAGSLKLTAEATRPDGRGVDLYPRPCGSTCFTIRYRLTPGTTVVRAHLSSSAWRGGTVSFAIPWPLSPEKPKLLRRIAARMNDVPALALYEAVTSGPGNSGRPTRYTLTGPQFMKTELYRSGAVDVRVVGRQPGLTQLAFALPGSKIWYRIWFDARYRLRREMIVSPGHLIRRSFRYGAEAARARGTSALPSAVVPAGGVPPPPPGALTLGREDGDLAVGLAVRPRSAGLELQTTVLAPNGHGLSGLDVSYLVQARGDETAAADPCGSGCYRARVRIGGRPTVVSVRLAGAGRPASTVEFRLPRRWPVRPADALLRRATRVFRSLRTLITHERLASTPTNVVFTTYQLAAPDRLAYQIKGGPQAVIIGHRRWDRRPGGPWKESAQVPVRQPAPVWQAATNAHLIGHGRLRGRRVWFVSFYDPRGTAFFTIAVEKETLRTLDLRMTAAAHFMHQRYSRFNAPLNIMPPP